MLRERDDTVFCGVNDVRLTVGDFRRLAALFDRVTRSIGPHLEGRRVQFCGDGTYEVPPTFGTMAEVFDDFEFRVDWDDGRGNEEWHPIEDLQRGFITILD